MRNLSRTYEDKAVYDAGLASHFQTIFTWMGAALMISGLTAFGIYSSPELSKLIWTTNLAWVVIFLPLVMSFGWIFLISAGLSPVFLQLYMLLFAVAMGASMSVVFMVFKMGSIVQVFFITSAMFTVTAAWGYTTKKDLSSWGNILLMGLIGIIIAAIVNIFLASSALAFAISVLGVIIFTGLTAYDMQNLKDEYYQIGEHERKTFALMGALSLYMNFVNLFFHLLQALGEKKE
jgi:FtsH-binding integral membrane protein